MSAADDRIDLAETLRTALERADLDCLKGLLDADARWGDPSGPNGLDCKNREEIVAWWARARDRGASAVVTELSIGPSAVLVGLAVTGRGRRPGDTEDRWQVWTIKDTKFVDVRGFADRRAAVLRAGLADE